ncbi:MAG: hypothetical protein HQM13_13905 [SAR324 cluster bacterium]|nr:hypothetical protein [SAR324 cluster bacterium]
MQKPGAKKKDEAALLKSPEGFNKGLEKFIKSSQFLLLLPADVIVEYQPILQKRFSSLGIGVKIAKADALRSGDYHAILSYHDPGYLNKVRSDDSKQLSASALFRIEGAPRTTELQPLRREKQPLLPLERRFNELKEITLNQVKDNAFVKLAYHHDTIQESLRVLKEKQDAIKSLENKIAKFDKPYYLTLSYILAEAVSIVTGVSDSVEDVMKGLLRVLIIDDLNKQTIDGMIPLGYNRKHLSVMSTYELHRKYKAYVAENIKDRPAEELTIKDFLKKSEELDQYDIILINYWHFHDENLPITVRVKQKTILSKKEDSQLKKDPKVIEEKSKQLEKQRVEILKQIKQVDEELKQAELQTDFPEEKYQVLIKKRKRILKNFQRYKADFAKNIVAAPKGSKFVLYNVGLLETAQKNQSLRERVEEKYFKIDGVRDFLKSHFPIENELSIPKLKEMLQLAQSRHKAGLVTEQRQDELNALQEKIEQFAKDHGFWDTKTGYRSFLQNHTLNKIELAALGAAIARAQNTLHVYNGPYFEVEGVDVRSDWNSELLAALRIRIAAEGESISTKVFQKFFQIRNNELVTRVRFTKELPTPEEFEEKKFELLIISQEAFSVSDIFKCLEGRNRSANNHIPVLLLDTGRQSVTSEESFQMHLMIGLPENENEEVIPNPPPFQIHSVTDEKSLFSTLAEIFGIPLHLVKS